MSAKCSAFYSPHQHRYLTHLGYYSDQQSEKSEKQGSSPAACNRC